MSFKNDLGKIYLETHWSQKILRLVQTISRHDQVAVQMLKSFHLSDSEGGWVMATLQIGHEVTICIISVLCPSHFSQDHSVVFLLPAVLTYFLLPKTAIFWVTKFIKELLYVKHCERNFKEYKQKESLREETEEERKNREI